MSYSGFACMRRDKHSLPSTPRLRNTTMLRATIQLSDTPTTYKPAFHVQVQLCTKIKYNKGRTIIALLEYNDINQLQPLFCSILWLIFAHKHKYKCAYVFTCLPLFPWLPVISICRWARPHAMEWQIDSIWDSSSVLSLRKSYSDPFSWYSVTSRSWVQAPVSV